MHHRGPFTNTAASTVTMLRLQQNASIFASVSEPAAGSLSGNEELLVAEGFVALSNMPKPSSGNYITVFSIVTLPTTRGSVTLNSTNPFVHPVIDPNYLTTDFDQYTAVQAMRDAFTVLSAPSLSGYINAPYGPLVNLTSDTKLLEYVMQHGVTINQCRDREDGAVRCGLGSCRSRPKGQEDEGLRIVDASVFFEIPECHTMATV